MLRLTHDATVAERSETLACSAACWKARRRPRGYRTAGADRDVVDISLVAGGGGLARQRRANVGFGRVQPSAVPLGTRVQPARRRRLGRPKVKARPANGDVPPSGPRSGRALAEQA